MSIKVGKFSEPFEVSYVKHDLRADKNVTVFSIADHYRGLDGSTKTCFVQCTAWEDLPLQECTKSIGEKVKIMFINQTDRFERKDKTGVPKLYDSYSVKCEVVT